MTTNKATRASDADLSTRPSSSNPDTPDLRTPARPPRPPRIMARAELRKVLRRAGYSATDAQFVLGGRPDPVDFTRDGERLFKLGVSLDRLIDAVGGSP